MKFDIKKSLQYKYISYKLKKECLKNSALQSLSEDEKEEIRIEAAKKTRKITLLIIMIYIPVICWFIFGFVGNCKYMDNPFVKWLSGIYESVFPLINGDWGTAWYQKRGTVLTIFIELLPALIIQAVPLCIPVMIMANRNLKVDLERIASKRSFNCDCEQKGETSEG